MVITLRHEERGLIGSRLKADGKKDRRNGRLRSEVTLLNKVTEGERNGPRQSDRRYEEDRRSDSLKRYKGMFDFLCPKLSALQNNLTDGELRLARIARITISHTLSARTGRQQEIEVRHVQRDSQKEFLTLKVRLLLLFLNIC